MASDRTERDYRARVARAVTAIIENPTADLHLDDLARLANFSPFHFHRVYAGVVGETVAATIRRVRLALATRLLTGSNESITQVALAVGYDSPQAFTRAFHEFTGQSPRAFRQQMTQAFVAAEMTPPPPRRRIPAGRHDRRAAGAMGARAAACRIVRNHSSYAPGAASAPRGTRSL